MSRLTRIPMVNIVAIAVAACGLAACVGGKKSPDEFAIVTKAPLVIPPDFSLRPPAPGEESLPQNDPRARARNALYGPGGASAAGLSQGEMLLLARANTQAADPAIRAVLNSETGRLAQKDRGLADMILFWNGAPPIDAEEPLDPAEEERRLQYWELRRAAMGDAPVEIRRSKVLNLPGIK
ncbi:MAG: DUF3035 domain-containing protein [Parvularculaceae bacterium]